MDANQHLQNDLPPAAGDTPATDTPAHLTSAGTATIAEDLGAADVVAQTADEQTVVTDTAAQL